MSRNPKKKPYQKKSFESTGRSSDTSSNVYRSMMLSDAWKSLSANQKVLYGACKSQYYGESEGAKRRLFKSIGVSAPEGDIREYFSMNQAQWMDAFQLYNPGNEKGFYRDMKVLIDRGFIDLFASGRNLRVKSIYKYSYRWREYISAIDASQ